MEMLGLKKTLDRMAKANGVRWYGHVIRKNDEYTEECNDAGSEWETKAGTAENDMEEAGGRECEGSRVEDQESCRSNEMEGRCESNRGGDEVYQRCNQEETRLKLEDDDCAILL